MRLGWLIVAWMGAVLAAPSALGQTPPGDREVVVGLPHPHRARGLVTVRPNGERDGFARRVVAEAAAAVGLRVRFVNITPEDEVEALELYDVDAVAPLSVMDERMDRVAYTGPLMVARGTVVSRSGAPEVASPEDLRGRRIVVAGQGVGHTWCVEQGLEARHVASLREALEEVQAGRADYAVSLQVAARQEIESLGLTGLRECELNHAGLSRAFAIACRPADTALVAAFNRGLGILEDSGRFDELYVQWVDRYQPRRAPPLIRRDAALVVGAVLLGLALAGLAGTSVLWVRARRQANAVRDSERQYQLLAESMPALVWVTRVAHDGTGTREWVSSNEAEWRARFPALELDAGCGQAGPGIHPDDLAGYESARRKSRDEQCVFDREFRLRDAGGEYRWVHTVSVPSRHADGLLWQTVCLDVTDLRRAQEALRAGEARYRAFIEQSSEGVWRLALHQPVPVALPVEEQIDLLFEHAYLAECNDAMARMFGLPAADQLAGTPLRTLRPPDDPANRSHLREFVVSGYRLTGGESREVAADGSVREFSNSLVGEVRDGMVWGAWGTQREITEQRRAERARAASEHQLRQVIDNAPNVATQGYDATGRVMFWNKASERMYGWTEEEAVGKRLGELILEPQAAEGFIRQLRDLDNRVPPAPMSLQDFRRRDGTKGWLYSTLFPITLADGTRQYICMDVDVTERFRETEEKRALEEKVRQMERLESLGALAGGIAHDFNNLLVGILGGTSAARRNRDLAGEQDRLLQTVELAARRAAELVAQLLAYAGRVDAPASDVELRSLVAETVQLSRPALPPGVDLRAEGAPAPVWVRATRAQVLQVCMNLVTNAAEAMNGAPGAILVRVGVEGVTEEQAASLRGSLGQAGEYACIEVRDSGQGMPPGILDRIFDPFFSTKVAGRGLGLAAVMGIVRSLGGAIGVHSREGLGTVFRVYLPRSAPAPAGEPAGRDAAGTARAGGLRVLVVDDEPLVRTVAVTALRAEGCDADTATSGEEAVECIAISPRAYDAVLLDLTMPGMGGLAALRRIRDAAPDLPIVLTSGVTPDGDAAEALALPSVRFLAKPYDVVELSAAIRSAAGEAAPASG